MATSASRRSRIAADRRAAMRCVSSARAWCRAAPTARRNTESTGARTCAHRGARSAPAPAARLCDRAVTPRLRGTAPVVPPRRHRTYAGAGTRRCAADVRRLYGDRRLPARRRRGASRRQLPTAGRQTWRFSPVNLQRRDICRARTKATWHANPTGVSRLGGKRGRSCGGVWWAVGSSGSPRSRARRTASASGRIAAVLVVPPRAVRQRDRVQTDGHQTPPGSFES